MLRLGYLFICLLFISHSYGQSPINAITLQGNKYSLSKSVETEYTTFIFLSPECPLSQSYSLTIRKLFEEFKKNRSIVFLLVFPGKHVEKQEIRSFLSKYKLTDVKVLLDPQLFLTHRLNATTTPQAVVLNNKLEVQYSGQIDNWAISLGIKRQVVTAFYLRDALLALQNNTPVKVQKTTPVGCFIE